ncbi:MAG: MBL fold metallo-hydrolase [Planctomycetota bacterium]
MTRSAAVGRHRGAVALRRAIAAALLASTACTPTSRVEVASELPAGTTSRFRVFVLGRAQDGGMPHVGCDRACCAAARRGGRRETPACLGVQDRESGSLLLLEATPAVEEQLARLHALAGSAARGRAPVDGVLLTHAHIGHYLGLAHFGREVAATRGLPVWVSTRMATFLRSNGPWRQLVDLGQIDLREFAPGARFAPLAGLEVEAIPVPHRDEFSDTMAFKLRGPRGSVLFLPDVDAWERHAGLLERLLEGVDVAYLDGTFFDGRELPERLRAEIPHPPMVDTMRRLRAFAAAHPGAVRFLHLNHTNPVFADSGLLQPGFALARVGEAVDL